LVLNLDGEPDKYPDLVRARGEGWQIHRVSSWANLLDFAREFSRRAYGSADRT
jgi:hypothetical protein